jgi:hypothetical protein
MGDKNGCKILIGLNDILGYIQISKPMFYQFIEMGLPARVINNRWYAHKDNIDQFFMQYTLGGQEDIPQDAE